MLEQTRPVDPRRSIGNARGLAERTSVSDRADLGGAPLGIGRLLTTLARAAATVARPSADRRRAPAGPRARSIPATPSESTDGRGGAATAVVTVSPMAALGYYLRVEGPVTPPALCAVRVVGPARG